MAGFSDAIERLNLMPREKNKTVSPIDYWLARKQQEPIIYALSSIINASAPTQTSVERAFSGLNFILNPLRTTMRDDHLEQVLLIRLNKDLFEAACNRLNSTN